MTTPIIWFSDYQKAANTGNTSAALKSRIRELIEGVSALIEAQTERRFDRYYDERFYDSRRVGLGGAISDDGMLMLDRDLDEILTLTNDHSVSVGESDYKLYPYEASAPYKTGVSLLNDLYFTSASYPARHAYAVGVAGFWGYGGKFNRKTTITADIDDSTQTIPVASTAGLEMGQMLRLGDELMLITDEVTTLNLTVERGYNDSPPASHASAAGVYLFRADPIARRLALRVAKWQSELDDNPLVSTVTVGDFEQALDLTAAPSDVVGMIEVLTRSESIGAV